MNRFDQFTDYLTLFFIFYYVVFFPFLSVVFKLTGFMPEPGVLISTDIAETGCRLCFSEMSQIFYVYESERPCMATLFSNIQRRMLISFFELTG